MVYNRRFTTIFWQIYWHQFAVELLEKRKVIECVDIMDTWFTNAYSNLQYVSEAYFLALPAQLVAIGSAKQFKSISKDFLHTIETKKWSYVIRPYLPEVKSGFLGGLFGSKN